MVKGYCRTNLDEMKREIWPLGFVAVPRVGDRVRSKSGKELKVVSIVHHAKISQAGQIDACIDNK